MKKKQKEQLLQEKYDHLKEIIVKAESAAVAFSGGVDSTFLLKICVELLDSKVLAITARSETYPARELSDAKDLASQMSVKHIIIDSKELEVPGFSDNPPQRCFMCKTELFSRIKEITYQHRIDWMFDGSNADDVQDYRPGRVAAKRLGVRSPLEEAGLGKKEIRTLSKMLNLPTWDKPSFACLSSRFPYHEKITKTALRQVENAEDYLWQLGMRVFRVRHHDSIARIELGKKEMGLVLEAGLRDQIVKHFKSLGYKYVTLDMEGYRTGSMNETLTDVDNLVKNL
jgi:uncharacterized protein